MSKKFRFRDREIEANCRAMPFMSQGDWCVWFALLYFIRDNVIEKAEYDGKLVIGDDESGRNFLKKVRDVIEMLSEYLLEGSDHYTYDEHFYTPFELAKTFKGHFSRLPECVHDEFDLDKITLGEQIPRKANCYNFDDKSVEKNCKLVPWMSQNDWCVWFYIMNYIKTDADLPMFENDLDAYCRFCDVNDTFGFLFLDGFNVVNSPYWTYDELYSKFETLPACWDAEFNYNNLMM